MLGNCSIHIIMKTSERNYGIDLLRIVAMFFVVLLHQLYLSGGLSFTENMSVYRAYWFLEIIACGAVNMFAMISGYVSYREEEKKRKWSSLLSIWFQAIFYGAAITLAFKLINPETVSWYDVIKSAFPVLTDHYWYLSAYIGLYIIMPIIDAAVRAMSREALLNTMAGIIIFFSFIDVFTGADFNTLAGYSVIWLVILYFIGATIKKCRLEDKISTEKCILLTVGLLLVTWVVKISNIDLSIGNSLIQFNSNTLVSYCSPTILIVSMLFVIVFSKLRISEKAGKLISLLASGAFAAYLINLNCCVWAYILPWQQPYMYEKSAVWLVTTSVLFCVLFLTVSIAIDIVRTKLFELTRINELITLPDRMLEHAKN